MPEPRHDEERRSMNLPAHPDSEGTTSHDQPPATTSRAAMAVLVIVGTLIAVIVVLHLTGVVGPGAAH